MRVQKFTQAKSSYNCFPINVYNLSEVLHFAVRGPLGFFTHPTPHYKLSIHVHPNRGVCEWFDFSKKLLDWFSLAQRSVSVGYYMELGLNGVAYKVEYLEYSHAIQFDLGYSHYICVLIPEDVSVRIEKRKLTIFSPDYVWLTTMAYKLKKLRWPDPYRGKGVVYKNEKLKLKPGKQRQ